MFKQYIREELGCYSAGMSTNMKRNFKFVNVSGNAYHDILRRNALMRNTTLIVLKSGKR